MLSIAANSLRSRQYGASLSQINFMPASTKGLRRGFTLIELLTVIAIIGILSAITFGVVKGVNERAAIGQAKAELGAISQALENYKRQYGDYPQAGSSNSSTTTISSSNAQYLLFNALTGSLGPTCDTSKTIKGKSFIDVAQFSLLSSTSTDLPTPGSGSAVSNAFIDPWGRLYWYIYKSSGSTSSWKTSGYLLFSAGPDGSIVANGSVFTDGIVTDAFKQALSSDKGNPDNIYANE